MKKLHTLRMLLVLALLGWVGNAWALDWTGTVAGRTFTSNTTVNLTGNVTLTGRVNIENGCTVTIRASGANRTITRGSGYTGLMFYVYGSSTLKIVEYNGYVVTISGNKIANCGSVIQVNSGSTANLTKVTIKDNYQKESTALEGDGSNNTHGGAIFARGTVTCTDCTITNCRSDQGGGICVFNRGNVTVTGGTISSCTAYFRGGAAGVANTVNRMGITETAPSGSATLTLSGVTISSNTAKKSFGGGVYSEFLRAKATIKDNTEIKSNKSYQGGHGVCVADMGDIDLQASKIHDNYPYERSDQPNPLGDFGGGGLYIGGTVTDGATAYIKANCLIYNNKGSRGGGVYMAGNMYLYMQGGKVYNNYTYVGSAYNNWQGNEHLAVGADGGGIYMFGTATTNGSRFEMSGGEIYGNRTARGTAYSQTCYGRGGGVYVGAGTVVISGGSIYSNNSVDEGGGIYNALGNVTMSGGNVYNNNANNSTKNGGGLYLASGSFTMSGGKIYTNKANDGAGAYLAGGSFTMSGSAEMYSNQAARHGGGIYLANGSPTVQGSAKIYTNTAGTNGGGLYLYKGTFNMKGGQIYGNTAASNGGGAFLTAQCTYNMTGGSLGVVGQAKNSAPNGGGIYDAGKFTMNGSSATIANNEATTGHGGGAYISTTQATSLTSGSVVGNTAGQNGGGIYVTGGSAVTVSGLSVYDNEAINYGGGLYITSTEGNSFKMTGGSIGTSGHPNKAKSGGGVYDLRSFEMTGGTIGYNIASTNGGGAYINSTVETKITNGTIISNTASNNGGGIYLANGQVTITSATFNGNTANWDNGQGGGIYASGSMTIKGTSSFIKNQANLGGAGVVNNGTFSLQGGTVGGSAANANKARRRGGGFYVTGTSTVTLQGGEVSYNEAITASDGAGGGLYVNSGTMTVSGTSAVIKNNTAKSAGGGVYVEGGSFTMSGGNIGGTVAQGNNTQSGGSGGGLYMKGGTATMTGGAVSGNGAPNGYGGGVYMEGGSCTLSGGAAIGASGRANSARNGGGIYSAGGAITVRGGKINYNTADADGGGIYSNGPTATVLITKEGSTLSYLQYNTAVNGGGIFANRGEVEFVDGTVSLNYASTAGGGMYVNDEGTLKLKGSAILNRNHVPTGKNGGGVYLKGTVVVGEASKAQSVVTADKNFAHDLEGTETAETYEPTELTRNNIYLPVPEAHAYTETNHRDVITVIEGGISTTSHIGFSVPHNHVPVIFCTRSATSWEYLDRFTTGAGHDLNLVLFDDSERYKSVHYTTWPSEFDPDHVYLYGFWPEAVTSLADVPDNGFVVNGDTITISNKEGLAWLISYVNGLNGSDPHTSSDLVVNLEADVAMGDFGWVPIGFLGVSGSTPEPFQGTFNGNGHIVSDISGLVYGQGLDGVLAYGMFGYVNDADINNVFVKNLEYHIDNNPDLVMGALVGEVAGATDINNSETQGILVASNPNAILGGLIGRIGNTGAGSPTIHSTMAIADMTGGTMGGLIGSIVKGDMLNSFANTSFNKTGNAQYAGGLVAINRGNVENCYSRLRPTIPTSNFGSLVGDNNNGTVTYCYAHPGQTTFKVTGNAPTGHGNFGLTFLPYLYGHRDTQVSLANSNNNFVPTGDDVDKQMLIALNAWVNQDAAHKATYTKWGRPWQVSEDMKPLNDDYPILRMPEYEAVAAQNGDPYLYYGLVDDLMADHTAADEAIWMYKSSENVTGDNSASAASLYIAEDVVLLNDNALTAYVGVTLDNSAGLGGAQPTYAEELHIEPDATDWHMVSTPLSDAPIGINYDNGTYDFDFGHPAGMPYYLFFPKDNARHGYFPSHRFGKDYPTSDATIEEGSYFNEWDFYSYDETNYHWINFKRNSNSHHHFDTPEHETIDYYGDGSTLGNETYWIPGKGYFAATREETFLQCLGTLNADEVDYNLTRTEGVPRHGYNLLGNPYQAYLDFDLFAEANSEDVDAIWDDLTKASYTILDEDYERTIGGDSVTFYHTYLYGSSDNEGVGAGRFIHPHQGFFVLLEEPADAATAFFYPDQRNATDTVTSKFRGDAHINYPLVNLFAIEENGLADVVTIELGRPTEGGAKVMKGLRLGNGKMWCHYNDEDYTIAYTLPGISEANVRFETVKDTEYTMRWNTRNGEFSYLHLIDNMTGADIDCLSASEYKFFAKKSDYKSRFKLVFGYTGIEEPEEVEANQNFAFVMGDELVVTGEGLLQVFDVNGRMVAQQELHGVQTTMALPNVANGVYVMRLTEGKQSRVQKMVISK